MTFELARLITERSLNGIRPGVSTRDDVRREFGITTDTQREKGGVTWTYGGVSFLFRGPQVASITVDIAGGQRPTLLTDEGGLLDLEPDDVLEVLSDHPMTPVWTGAVETDRGSTIVSGKGVELEFENDRLAKIEILATDLPEPIVREADLIDRVTKYYLTIGASVRQMTGKTGVDLWVDDPRTGQLLVEVRSFQGTRGRGRVMEALGRVLFSLQDQTDPVIALDDSVAARRAFAALPQAAWERLRLTVLYVGPSDVREESFDTRLSLSTSRAHVVADSEGGWAVHGENLESERFATKTEAESYARQQISRVGGEVVIHAANGSVESREILR